MLRSDMDITLRLALSREWHICEPPPNIASQGYLQLDACGVRAKRCLRLSHTRFHPPRPAQRWSHFGRSHESPLQFVAVRRRSPLGPHPC